MIRRAASLRVAGAFVLAACAATALAAAKSDRQPAGQGALRPSAGTLLPQPQIPHPLFLHPLFQDHAVLQRERPVRVWGWSAPGEEVTVSFAGTRVSARTDASGRWDATLPPMSAGGPYDLSVQAANGTSRTVHDVVVGEVWLCSGQSNMVLQVKRTLNSRAEIADSANDSIRMLTVGLASSLTPLATLTAPVEWQPASPATDPEFSAACFYFARELQKTVHVPMGLINSSWGGSNITAWMSENALRAAGGYDAALSLLNLRRTDPAAANLRWGEQWQAWWRSHTATSAGAEPWNAAPSVSDDWRKAPPTLGPWETWGIPQLASYNGIVWYRTTVSLDARQAAQAATLSLGTIDEVDETWVNGHAVGYTSGPGTDRVYALHRGQLRAGDNTIAIAALDTYGDGGLYGPAEKRALKLADGTSIPLDAGWRFQIAPPDIGPAPRAPWEEVSGLTTIYNAMLAPLFPYTLRGVLWYQGESNTEDAPHYGALLSGLMADWRSRLGADLPFLIVQLAGYGPAATAPIDSGWARLREQQRLAVAHDAHAALAVTVDIGDRYDIHPANKQELGRRLARAARHLIYGEPVSPSGPVALAAHRDGKRVEVTFGDVDGHLVVYGANRAIGFELCAAGQATCRFADAVAGRDRVWLEIARDEGRQFEPTRVRFCWADSPICNLYDESGLPAGPFEIAVR
jgi:sialate O-acetylesterase